jgi:hypothetical protein
MALAVVLVLAVVAGTAIEIYYPNPLAPWGGWSWSGWIALTGVATFAAAAVALSLGVWKEELEMLGRGPRLGLTFQPPQHHFQKFVFPLLPGFGEYDVRMSVKNDGSRSAERVEVWARDLHVEQPDGTYERDDSFMAMNLSRTHVGGTVEPVIHRGMPKPFDLLSCLDPDRQRLAKRQQLYIQISTLVQPVAVQPVVVSKAAPTVAATAPDHYPSLKPPGKYRLEVVVGADRVDPVSAVVEIEWTGTWTEDAPTFFADELKIRLVPPSTT